MRRGRNTKRTTDLAKLSTEQKQLVRKAVSAQKKLTANDSRRGGLIAEREQAVLAALDGGVGPTMIAKHLGVTVPVITKIDKRSETAA